MKLQNIISSLMPINKNDKVDMLIQQMKENSILMDLDADNAIRIAIKK